MSRGSYHRAARAALEARRRVAQAWASRTSGYNFGVIPRCGRHFLTAIAVVFAVASVVATAPARGARQDPAPILAAAQAKLDAGDPDGALKLLDPLVKR